MPAVDIERFIEYLKDNALPAFGRGQCAKHVRLALQSGGASTSGHPAMAKDWGPTLQRIGFRAVALDRYRADKGDVCVIQGTSASAAGHIQAFDGLHWVSDFVQTNGFWPGPSYRNEIPAYVVYRP